MIKEIPQAKIAQAAQALRGLGHELRLTVLCHLINGPMCVYELMEATGASQPNLSQHLAKMRMMGLLVTQKKAQKVFYALSDPKYADLIAVLQSIYCPELE
ncbi:MAG: metalloregulator ArsR/SmtB family transcription factor [Mariprofundaceae bacterium]|nr:metalloregulator ArsR/SmtB family transcription factor [Mariprofundaceae bacterium]